jgi:hypothetical protein
MTALVTAILDSFVDLPDDMKAEGKDMLLGLLGGIEDDKLQSDINSAAKGSADDVVSTIKNAWDINSPSLKAKGISQNFMSGLENGFTSKKPSLLSTVGSIANDLLSSFLNLFGISWGQYSSGTSKTKYPSHATGLDYVPYDGYIAELHRGESVDTEAETLAKNRGNDMRGIDTASIASAVASAVVAGLDGVGVYIDGKKAGKLVAAGVSDALGAIATTRQRRG